jgi:crossover junction endodeoxyribonuclease RusA
MTAESFARQNADDRMFAGLAMPPRVVLLGWPDPKMSPNARVHWGQRSLRVRIARQEARVLTMQAFGPRKPEWAGARLAFTFNPPDKRRRDTDNCIASTKAVRDGIADALGIDDSKFECSYRIGEVVKGGAVRVEIRGIS